MRTGLVGCGVLGRRLGRRLLGAGHPLTVHDRDKSRATPLLEAGATWADTPSAVGARCELLVTALPGPAEAESVALGDDGLWSGAQPKTIHLETSTVGPDCVRRLARAADAREIRFLDGPVSAGVHDNRGTRLVLWVGGDPNYFDLARPTLDVLADRITYCGAVGNGQITKLINNLITQSLTVVLGEALTLGVRAGVPLDMLHLALHHGTAQNRLLDQMFPQSVFRGNWEPGLRLDLALKDLGLAEDLAADTGLSLPMKDLATRFYEQAESNGWGDLSAHSVVRLIEETSKATLRIQEPE